MSKSTRHFARRVLRPQSLLLISIISILLTTLHFLKQADYFSTLVAAQPGTPLPSAEVHPVRALIETARTDLQDVLSTQSDSLQAVIAKYKLRNGRNPPPNFDRWYAFARKNEVPLIDEYDGIRDVLQPFWGLSPAAIRARVRTALSADLSLIEVSIREGKVQAVGQAAEWKRKAIRKTIEPFAGFLPDMDIAINAHDEPRVIIPHDQLAQLLDRARSTQKSPNEIGPPKSNSWSDTPADLNRINANTSGVTPWLEYDQQYTWSVGTLSCPPDSPARTTTFDGHDVDDLAGMYSDSLPLGFVWNHTALTDVCLSPSYSRTAGIFNRPNKWDVTHDAVPIFSPSKISCFHDILYPAPWYMGERVEYDVAADPLWDQKNDTLYWRGTTTNGYSVKGTWHRHGRQRFVETVEKPGSTTILKQPRWGANSWQPTTVERTSLQSMFDVHFTGINQCADADCREETAYFDVRPKDDYEVNWRHKFLLDMDGHAHSGRFYSFLQSRSLTLKHTLFREWHDGRITPWAHFIPLGMNGSDHYEIMRWLTQESDGRQMAKQIAEASTVWAKTSLRQVDMQAWMFRLLLEYARLIDDARDDIGFA